MFIKFLGCPSDVTIDNGKGSTSNSYVVNCGRIDANPPFTAKPDIAARGVFFDHSSEIWKAKYAATPVDARESMSLDRLTQLDGSTNTLMLSENVQATDWIPRDYLNTDPALQDNRRTPIKEFDCGFVWSTREAVPEGGDPTTAAATTFAINEDLGFRVTTCITLACPRDIRAWLWQPSAMDTPRFFVRTLTIACTSTS